MRAFIAILSLLATTTSASAQRTGAAHRASADRTYTVSQPNPVKNGAIQSGDVRDCRVAGRTRATECRSRDGWRNVQRELDRLTRPREPEDGGF